MLRGLKIMLALVLAFPFTYFGACQNTDISNLTPQEPVTIDFWHYYAQDQKDALDKLLLTFEQSVGADKGITVRSRGFDSIDDLTFAVAVASERDRAPDLFSAYPDTAWDLAQDGKLVDLTEYLSESELQVFSPTSLQAGRINGDQALYQLPLVTSSEIVAINMTAWRKFAAAEPRYADAATVFSTFESIVAAADAYHQWSGKPLFGFDSIVNFAIIGHRQLGIDLFQTHQGQGKIELDRQTMRQIWQIYHAGTVKGGFSEVGRYRSDDLKTGDLVAAVVSTAAGPYLSPQVITDEGTVEEVELKTLPYPVFADGDPVCVQQGAGVSVMRSETDREIAAAVLLQWLTRPEQNVSFSLKSGYLPATQPALQSQLLHDSLSSLEKAWPQKALVSCCLKTFLEQTETYELYAPPAFENSYPIRGVISHSLRHFARQARADYLADKEAGMHPELLEAKYINDAVFEVWYSQLISDLEPFSP